MLLASKGGTVSAVKIVRETRYTWTLIDDKVQSKVSKRDPSLRVFRLMSQALEWACNDQKLIDHFKSQEASENSLSNTKILNS